MDTWSQLEILSFNYFDSETTCKSCNTRIKKENQLVCDYCHEHELKPEWLEE